MQKIQRKNKQHHDNNKEKIREKKNAAKKRTHVMTRMKGIEKETGKQIGQQQKKDTKETKIK